MSAPGTENERLVYVMVACMIAMAGLFFWLLLHWNDGADDARHVRLGCPKESHISWQLRQNDGVIEVRCIPG